MLMTVVQVKLKITVNACRENRFSPKNETEVMWDIQKGRRLSLDGQRQRKVVIQL